MRYKDSGVNIDTADKFVNIIKPSIRSTFRSGVLEDIGGFAGLFSVDLSRYNNPILVSSTDNNGIGLIIVVPGNEADNVINELNGDSYLIGEITYKKEGESFINFI